MGFQIALFCLTLAAMYNVALQFQDQLLVGCLTVGCALSPDKSHIWSGP